MLEHVRSWWGDLLDGFWLVPGVVALTYAALALGVIQVDRATGSQGVGFAFGGDAEAARAILMTIAGSLITVAGLAFSLTIIVLTLVSSQFSPRAVHSMLADRLNQVVAGSFVGIFAYCLLVLRTVREQTPATGGFVPALGVTLAIALALVALALLLAFIHHAGVSVQVSHISARIARATAKAIDRLYPDPHGETLEESGNDLLREWREDADPATVEPACAGYVQSIALDDIADRLASATARVHVTVCPGDFVSELTTTVEVWARDALDDDAKRSLRRAVVVGDARDLRQDAAYGLRQLVDIAVKALSPGVNDPSTAVTCIAHLGATLELLAGRSIPSPVRHYPSEDVVLVARRMSFDDYVRLAFSEIGRHATGDPRVVGAILEALGRVADAAVEARAADRCSFVYGLARSIAAPALAEAGTDDDRTEILRSLQRLEDVAFQLSAQPHLP